MIKELKEINQVGTFKEVPEGFKKIYLRYL